VDRGTPFDVIRPEDRVLPDGVRITQTVRDRRATRSTGSSSATAPAAVPPSPATAMAMAMAMATEIRPG
jgi:hypothetical protein